MDCGHARPKCLVKVGNSRRRGLKGKGEAVLRPARRRETVTALPQAIRATTSQTPKKATVPLLSPFRALQ